MGKPFDAGLKAAFLAAVRVHLAKGWSINSAYQQAKAEFQQEGKPVPDRAVVYRWLRQEGAFPRTGRTGRTSRTGRTNAEDEAEAAGEAAEDDGANLSDGSDSAEDEAPGEAADADDYTRKLEAMLRLYRRRTEADVDAVCDQLLPGLLEEGE